MPPKRGRKRKHTKLPTESNGDTDIHPLAAPDRATWPGWVEMESEPAFFNVMLKEMGVSGVRVQEVLGLDDELLAILPRPIHALIFLFRYKDTDQAQQQDNVECPKQIWFANQIPDFACASVALLNIVNNIKGLKIGKELQDFRDFTLNMDPISRGDAIDGFEFVKRIHNSFARETDLLTADMYMKQKAAKLKKRQAVTKARETREANKASKTPLKGKSLNGTTNSTRVSDRRKAESKILPTVISTNSRQSSPLSAAPDSDPPESDPEFKTAKTNNSAPLESEAPRRRSERQPKPRQDLSASITTVDDEDEEGFHFVAYIPIQDHVWKLDGLDSFPQDMGAIDSAISGEWIHVVQPALQTRMAMYEGADIEFNLMAVVHDPIAKDRTELAQNVKQLQMIDKRLDAISEDWRSGIKLETGPEVIFGTSIDLAVSDADIEATILPTDTLQQVVKETDVAKLIELRKQTICLQAPLRGSIRDAIENARADEEKARHRRHDYCTFVRSWLGALAEEPILTNLLEGA